MIPVITKDNHRSDKDNAVTEKTCYKWPRMCSVSRNNNPVHSSFMAYHRAYNKTKSMEATRGTGTATLPENPYPSPLFVGFVLFNLQFSMRCFIDHCLSFLPFTFWLLHCLSFFNWRLWITTLMIKPLFQSLCSSLKNCA
jgi:hypothetical protein